MRYTYKAISTWRNTHKHVFTICAVVCLHVLLVKVVFAQPTAYKTGPIVSSIEIEGQSLFGVETQLLPLVNTEVNRKLFGISGVTPWLWIYRWGTKSGLPSRLKEGIIKSGEKPAFLDLVVMEKDSDRLRLFFRQQGYRSAQVKAQVIKKNPDSSEVIVRFNITPGSPTFIRTFRYQGLDKLTPEQKERLLSQSLLIGDKKSADTLRLDNKRYIEPKLYEERRRIITFLQDEGYPEITRDSVRVLVTPVRPDSFDVTMLVGMGKRYRMGDIRFRITGPDGSLAQQDTLQWLEREYQPRLHVTATRIGEGSLNPNLLYALMQFSPGEWYNQSKLLQTKLLLEQTGLFPFTNFNPVYSAASDHENRSYVPIEVELRTRSRFEVNWDGSLLQRFNTNTSNEIGLGTGASVSDLNVWGQGEKMRLRVSASGTLERGFALLNNAQQAGTFSRSTQYDASLGWSFPYLRKRLSWMGPLFGVPFYSASTRIQVNYLHEKRDVIKLSRDRASLLYQLDFRHNRSITSTLNLFDFSFSDPQPAAGFEELFLSLITDPVQYQRAVEDYTVRKVNNAFRYAIRGGNADPLRRDKGYSSEFGAEIGGNLPFLLDRFAITPNTLEGTLPGIGAGSSLAYRQYARFNLDFRKYQPRGSYGTLAWKASAGWAFPTGSHTGTPLANRCGENALNANLQDCRRAEVPYERRFFIGGSSSLRAWGLGELGPGEATSAKDGLTGVLGGDVKLEASLEYRQVFVRNLFGADYLLATFVDAGNIWYDRRNASDVAAAKFILPDAFRQLGIGGGFGLRISWAYLILRFDWAVQMLAPGGTFFPNGIRFRFIPGLGQAF
ncbi:MAG: BamA/TamA family outer membrane protein [Rhodothermia bacterium]|nr:BamA/TamA family outer membrane protein [Rhodothermia bacterium]